MKTTILACLFVLLAGPALAAHWIEEPVGALEHFIRDHGIAPRLPGTRLGAATGASAGGPTSLEIERTGGGDFWTYRVVLSRGAQRIAVDASQQHHVEVRPGRVLLVAEGAHGEQVVVTLTLDARGRIASAAAKHDGPRRLFGARDTAELDVRF